MSEQQANKPHRKTKEKKKADHGAGHNPKAFAFAKPGKLQRRAARSHDVCCLACAGKELYSHLTELCCTKTVLQAALMRTSGFS